MTDGKTTHEFSMNTVHPLDRDFWFTNLVTLPICFLMLRHHYPFIPFRRLVMKRPHYLLIPCSPCSGKSRFDLVYPVHFNCKYFTSLYFIYARTIRTPPRDFASRQNTCGGGGGNNLPDFDPSVLNKSKIKHYISVTQHKYILHWHGDILFNTLRN